MSNKLVETVESLGGLRIEIWQEDLAHALNEHPDANLEKIRRTLGEPTLVIKSKKAGNACLFYSLELVISDKENLYFCVVVRISSPGIGKLTTAYDADYLKTGDVLFEKETK